jgi:hypothetical protein
MSARRDTSAAWSLTRFPNYAHAGALESIDALHVTEAEFRRRHVDQNRPCLVKNAAVHWPACERWRDLAYLRGHSTNATVTTRTCAVSEVSGWARPEVRERLQEQSRSAYRSTPFHDFLAQMESGDSTLIADSCRFSKGAPIEAMRDDIGGVPFLAITPRSRVYPPHRVFLYRNSYTDWHFHPTDETFMTQVVGAKEVLLLPPDEPTWSALRPLIQDHGVLYDIDVQRFPDAGRLQPLRVVVEPGDALYIPVFWWHAVESLDKAFGVTVAATFPTPLHVNGDWRFPVVRKLARTHLLSRHAPLVMGAIAYSSCYRFFVRLTGRRP